MHCDQYDGLDVQAREVVLRCRPRRRRRPSCGPRPCGRARSRPGRRTSTAPTTTIATTIVPDDDGIAKPLSSRRQPRSRSIAFSIAACCPRRWGRRCGARRALEAGAPVGALGSAPSALKVTRTWATVASAAAGQRGGDERHRRGIRASRRPGTGRPGVVPMRARPVPRTRRRTGVADQTGRVPVLGRDRQRDGARRRRVRQRVTLGDGRRAEGRSAAGRRSS